MTAPITGGCQCGAVRYAFEGPLTGASLCHCRMCQRAVGNVFAALVGGPRARLAWTSGGPAFFKSSTVATRGFCSACGTPLTFEYDAADRVSVTIGSLDDPELAPIEAHYGVESRVSWLKLCDGLPAEATQADDPLLAGLVSHQPADA